MPETLSHTTARKKSPPTKSRKHLIANETVPEFPDVMGLCRGLLYLGKGLTSRTARTSILDCSQGTTE